MYSRILKRKQKKTRGEKEIDSLHVITLSSKRKKKLRGIKAIYYRKRLQGIVLVREENSIKAKKKFHHNRNDYTPYNPSSIKLG